MPRTQRKRERTRGSQRLERWIARAGLSQRAAAKKLGIAQNYPGILVRGDARPGVEIAVRIEKVTKGAVRVADWFTAARQKAA